MTMSIVTMAQDSAFGRDGVKAFKESLKKAKLVHEEYLPPATTDFTAGGQRMAGTLLLRPAFIKQSCYAVEGAVNA